MAPDGSRAVGGSTIFARVVLYAGAFQHTQREVALQVARRLARQGVDAVVVGDGGGEGLIKCDTLFIFGESVPPHLAKVCRFDRLVLHIDNWMNWVDPERGVGLRPAFREALAAGAIVTATSDALAEALGDEGAAMVLPLRPGLDLDAFRLQPLPDAFTVGWAGDPLAGGGWQPKGTKDIRKACERAGVLFRMADRREAPVAQEAMPQFYAGISCYVCASDSEGYGLPMLEALASGRPVITTRVGVMPEIIVPGATGLFVRKTVDDLAGAIRTVEGWSLSGRQFACRQSVKRFDWKAVEAAWMGVLNVTHP